MRKNRPFIIGTATTPRKQAAIRKAKGGLLDTTSYEYAKAKWRASLFPPLRSRMRKDWWTDNDVWDFADECVNDAFTRIQEYNPEHKFRTFLAEVIIIPRLDDLYKAEGHRREGEKDYAYARWKGKPLSAKNLADEIKKPLEAELAKDVLRKLKEIDEMKYEVFCCREFNNWEYKDIADEWGISEANARQVYNRVKKETIPALFYEISQSNKYIDQDLKIRQDIIDRIRKEIKER